MSESHVTVDTAWLAAHLGDPDLVIFDASVYLPNEPVDAKKTFEEAHIPGAVFFDINEFADQETDLPHMVPTPGRFARLASAAGVSNGSMVVFYDQKGLFSAARGWWLMRLFGHERVAVLDGGLPKWRADGHATESGPAVPRAPASFIATLHGKHLRGIGDMLANVTGKHELVLDARAAPRFNAEVPEPRPGLAAGHIPGSHNLPFTELLNRDGTLLAPPELRARLAEAGVDADTRVVTSCGSGVTATVLALGIARAGYAPAAVYDGSWTEWGLRADTPKES